MLMNEEDLSMVCAIRVVMDSRSGREDMSEVLLYNDEYISISISDRRHHTSYSM